MNFDPITPMSLHRPIGDAGDESHSGIGIEDRNRTEGMLAGGDRILEMIAKGQPLASTLDAICHLVGELSPGSLCSILLLDWDEHRFRHGAAPDLPETYNRAMDGRVFESSSGACARAAKQGQRVIVPDIAADLVWVDRPELPLDHGLKACWSTPIFSQDEKVIGVFATYARTPSTPTAYQLHLIDQLTAIASIAIERERAAEALRAAEHVARGQVEALASSLAALSQEPEPEKFLEHVLRIAQEQLGAFGVSVWEMNEASGCVELAANYQDGALQLPASNEGPPPPRMTGENSEHPVWSEFFRSGTLCVYGRNHNGPPWTEVATHPDGPWYDWRAGMVDNPVVPQMIKDNVASGIVATLNIPMIVADKVVGLFVLCLKQRRAYRPDEIELTRAMANQAMLAIKLMRLSQSNRESAVIGERNRMARDIHDSLAQGFTGVIVQLQAAEDACTKGLIDEALSHVARAGKLARHGLKEARRSVQALRLQDLEDGDLSSAMDGLFRKLTAGTGLHPEFSMHGVPRSLPSQWEDNLLRIAQEVVTNALRYAHATEFKARLQFSAHQLVLELSDNGHGFDPTFQTDGFGLMGIRERVEQMDGQTSVQSAAGEGTTILITLPLKFDPIFV